MGIFNFREFGLLLLIVGVSLASEVDHAKQKHAEHNARMTANNAKLVTTGTPLVR